MRDIYRWALKLIPFVVVAVSCSTLSPHANEISTGEAFIRAIGDDDEKAAFALLGSNTQLSVTQLCNDGTVIGCFEALRRHDWGRVTQVAFVYGRPETGALAYTVGWEDTPSQAVIVLVAKEGDTWVVVGWRGFVVVNGENEFAALFSGKDMTNQFPPP